MCNFYFTNNIAKKRFLPSLDIRIKLVTIFLLLLSVLSSKNFLFPLVIACLCFSICNFIRVPLRVQLIRIAQPITLAIIVFLLKLLFLKGTPLFSFHFLGLNIGGSQEGLLEGALIFCRILAGVSLLMLLGFIVPFTEFITGLAWFKIPKTFIEISLLAYRYIFVFLEDASTIYYAQKNRLGYTGIHKGLKSFGTLTGALILKSFEQSQKTTEAMILRGYTGEDIFFNKKISCNDDC